MTRHLRRHGLVPVVVVLIALMGCSTATRGGPGSRESNILRYDEMSAVKAASLHDVINQLRPRWLSSVNAPRSFDLETALVVYQGQTYLGGEDVLKQFSPDKVAEVRFLDGAKASATLPGLGSRHVAAAIITIPR